MKFSQQRLFAYDSRLFLPATLEDAFKHGEDVAKPDEFALSGLMDLRETYEVITEYYERNFIRIDIKELARTVDGGMANVDDLYNEPVASKLQFSRKLQVPAHVSFGDPDIKHTKKGSETEQPITCYFGIPLLQKHDYFPDVGDHVVYLGRLYEFARVFYKPEDLFQNTGVPVHVQAVASPFQFGDRRPPTKISSMPGPDQPQS